MTDWDPGPAWPPHGGSLSSRSDGQRSASPAEPLSRDEVPPHIGDYVVGNLVGHGSFGTVVEAFDPVHDERVAIKLLHSSDPWAIEEFKNEARHLADVHHPSLVTPDETIDVGGRLALVMRFVEGRPFEEVLADAAGPAGALRDADRSARLVWKLLRAVDALHAAGFVHMDLKPGNVLVTPDEDVVLLDFGFTRHRTREDDEGSSLVGTPAYMAPEQLEGAPAAPGFDRYAIGVMLHRALTGRGPFDDQPDPFGARLFGPAPSLADRRPGLESAWVAVGDALLSRAPDDRLAVDDLVAALVGEQLPHLERTLRHEAPFVGRDGELARLQALWDGAADGAPVLAMVAGASGIGKTALVQRFLRQVARTSGAPAVYGRCFDREAIPYRALDVAVDWMCAHVRRSATLTERVHADVDLVTLQQAFPVFRTLGDEPTTSPVPPHELPLRLRDALKGLVRHLTVDAPLLLVLDDAHGGDADSVDLLVHLLSPPDAPRLMVVLTHRVDGWSECGFGRALLARLARGVPFTVDESELGTLDAHRATDALAQRLGRPADDPEVARRAEAAAGNPLLLALAEDDDGTTGVRLDGSRPSALETFVRFVALAGAALDVSLVAEAAEVPVPSRADLSGLVADHLVRLVSADGRRKVEPAHERISAALLADWPAEAQARAHGRLALALAARGGDPGTVAACWRDAGDGPRAHEWALRGARAAARAGAFARAAELFELALQVDAALPSPVLAPIRREHAEALLQAGLGERAATAWLDIAASEPAGPRQRACRRQAADALLVAGDVEGGLAIARPLLAELGAPAPAGTVGLVFRIVDGLRWILLHGRGLAPAASPDPRAIELADVLWTVAKGLVFVDPLRGLAALIGAVRAAARTGDARRLGRAMGPLAGFLLGQLPGFRAIGSDWLARLGHLAGDATDPYLLASSDLWRSLDAQAAGDYARAEALGRAAEEAFRAIPGATWEGAQAASLVARVLRSRGALLECTAMVHQYLRDAERRGDLYGRMLFGDYDVLSTLARGSVAEARTRIAWLRAHWLPERYTVQSAYAVIQDATIDLYEGHAERAAGRLVADRADFRRAGGYRFVFARIERNVLEARTALRCGDSAPAGLWTVDQVTKGLDGETLPEAAGHAALLRAALASRRGDRATALALLARAADAFDAARFPLEAAVARLRLAEVEGRDADRAVERARMLKLGVREPERWAAMVAPCFEGLTAA